MARFAIIGRPKRRPAGWLTCGPIAHRGQWAPGAARPENSLAAFEEAARNGFAIELDTRSTLDGVTVIFHDDDLRRITGQSGLVAETSAADLAKLQLLGGDAAIPTLEETLAVVAGRVPIFVELKSFGAVGALEDDVARQLAAYPGHAAVMSFNPYALLRVGELAPAIPRGQLSGTDLDAKLPWYERFALSELLVDRVSRPDFIAYDLAGLPSLPVRFQRWRGRPVIGWTAETKSDRLAAERYCDAVICDPDALP